MRRRFVRGRDAAWVDYSAIDADATLDGEEEAEEAEGEGDRPHL
jgi:hypothetical protein